MHILHVVPTYFPAVRYGGPIFAIHGLCRALAKRGHRVEVFTTSIDGPNDSAVPLGVPVAIDGVHVRYFRSKALRRLFWSPPLGRALDQHIGSFDIVHLHSVFLWPTWAAAQSARRANVPYLISPRGMLVKELIARRSRWAKAAWLSLIEKENLKAASAIHVTSAVEANELRRFAWDLPRIDIIPNGIDEPSTFVTDRISGDVQEIAAQEPVLFLGRISWKKGLDRLLRAIALTEGSKLAIVGTDDECILPELKKLACDLRITDRVFFLGRTVLGSDKECLYASARLFVLPSYSENFGNTVLEAMQHGVPVVTTTDVGAAQIVSDAKAGCVVDGEPESLGRAIQHLTENTSLAQAMGEAGRRHVRQYFGWRLIAEQMEELYVRLARNVRGTSSHQCESIEFGH